MRADELKAKSISSDLKRLFPTSRKAPSSVQSAYDAVKARENESNLVRVAYGKALSALEAIDSFRSDIKRIFDMTSEALSMAKSSASSVSVALKKLESFEGRLNAAPMTEDRVKDLAKELMPSGDITPEFVRDFIKTMRTLPETDRIEIQDIRNAQSFLFGGTKYKISELMHGGSSNNSTASTQVYGEVVAGSGTAWTLAHTPDTGTVRLYAIGQRLTPPGDYSISGANITTVNSWTAGDLLADYSYTA